MADITLVNLNMLYVRYVDSVDKELHLPLGPLYLVSALEAAGIDVDFRDYQLADVEDPFEIDAIARFCADPAPIIGLSCMANLLPFTVLAAKELKARYPDRIIVLGGVGPKAVEAKLLERFPWIDLIAHGEGERATVSLVEALSGSGAADLSGVDLSRVPGLFYRDGDPSAGGTVRRTEPAARIEHLDDVLLPAYERVPVERYDAYGMITSRGCPYKCTFCSVAPVWGHRSYLRSPESIIDEMRRIQDVSGADLFLFQDEFFVSSKHAVMAFCEALDRSHLKVRYKAFGRVNLTDRETMDALVRTGCIELRYGIESGSDRILELTEKGFTAADAVRVVSEATTVFPRVDAFFIWGFPFETMEDFYQTVFQMMAFRLMGARILPSLLCLLPQTKLYDDLTDAQRAQLHLSTELLPEYMVTGHEVYQGGRTTTVGEHRSIFDFIAEHPDLFPGFFLCDPDDLLPKKLAILQEHGFYTSGRLDIKETDSCGAHSPREG
jgi:radical SAM superfamily enzyme YgiQ (UPF0313 family)